MLFLQEENPAKAEKNDHKNGILNHKNQRNSELYPIHPYVRLTAFFYHRTDNFLGSRAHKARLSVTHSISS